MSGFIIAFEDGADMVELDVQTTADGTAVVFHDADLRRMCGQVGRVDALGDRQIRKLRIGRKYGKEFANEGIPFLDAVLAMIAGREAQVNIEIKDGRAIDEIVRLIQQLKLHHHVLVSAFDWSILDRVRRLDAGIHTGALYQFHLLPQAAVGRGAVALHPYHLGLMPWQVEVAHGLGLMVNTWTVNRPQAWRRLIEMGVDGIITDTPGRLRQWLKDNRKLFQ